MSYDLFFGVPGGREAPSPQAFRKHFNGRKNYELNESQAWYQSEDTGVYFGFDIDEPERLRDESEPDSSLTPCGVSFNLNYFRPHIFGLEAALELTRLVDRFELLVDDPQIDGMGRGRYSSEGFLAGWNKGNHIAYKVGLTGGLDSISHSIDTLPSDVIERYWRWNLQRSTMQDEVKEPAFVPRVMFIRQAGRVASFVTWTDGIPIVIPKVDFVILIRDELSVHCLPQGEIETALIEWEELEQRIPRSPYLGPLECWLIRAGKGPRATGSLWGWSKGTLGFGLPAPSPEVMKLFSETPVHPQPLEGIPVDKILDEEIVKLYLPSS